MICVVINTHKAYLDYLAPAIEAVDNQTLEPAQKIVAYDGARSDLKNWVPKDWDVVTARKKGGPNPTRNAALKKCKCDWIIYADGDDVMDLTYVEDCYSATRKLLVRVGVIYSDIVYSSGSRLRTPEWDRNGYWRLRQKNFISSTSCWRVEAIKEAGGWSEHTKCYDDYSLALDITALNWSGLKGLGVIRVQDHGGDHRRKAKGEYGNRVFPHVWYHKTYTMMTLMAGRGKLLNAWVKWIKQAHATGNLPPSFKVVVVDDSRSQAFSDRLAMEVKQLPVPCEVMKVPNVLDHQREKITFKRDRGPAHRHVARMYDYFVRKIDTDFLLMVEDDMIPPVDGLKNLAAHWDYLKRPAGIGGVYLSRQNGKDRSQGIAVASTHDRFWRCNVKVSDIKGLTEMKQIAGGFTLWNVGCLKDVDCIEYNQLPYGGRAYGWDTDLSLKLGNLGWKLFLAEDVYCEHKYEGN